MMDILFPKFVRSLCSVAILLMVTSVCHAAEWLLKDEPYRATVTLTAQPNDPAAGVEIEIPDFGVSRDDLGDALLLNPVGEPVPTVLIYHAMGKRSLLLAREMKAGTNYFLYFGGRSRRVQGGWMPKQGLAVETRTLGAKTAINTQTEMLDSWNHATNVNGVGFVNSINMTANPFGEGTNYASHFTGLYRTTEGEKVTFYTLSSDASFVLVDDRPALEWPGIHSWKCNRGQIHKGTVTATSDLLKIDYYQAKVSGGTAFAALGIERDGKYLPVPSEEWIHPGKARVLKIEQVTGLPVPCPVITFDSYMGFGGAWLHDVVFDAPRDSPEGWIPEWHFGDGMVLTGTHVERVLPVGPPLYVSLVYKKGEQSTKGVSLISFPDNLPAASVKDPKDLSRYFGLLSEEKPETLPASSIEPLLPFLIEYANNDLTGHFSTAWLQKGPQPTNPLWVDAMISSVRSKAQVDPKRALQQLQSVDAATRKQHLRELSMLELELMVFYLKDPASLSVARRVEFDLAGTPEAQLALIRIGDYYRLTDQPEKAEAQYASVQKEIPDETGGRKLPAMDRSYSIAVDNLLSGGMRREAEAKLREWELVHPLCKRDSDFLLLQARLLNSFGYWSQALAELDSFKKTHLDSPYEITADFYRAESLDGLGKKEEARKIRSTIVKDYPRHELAKECRQLLSKP
jgi:tetratricopeptide (TPR) repeat protein